MLRVVDNAEKVADVVDCNLTAHRPVQVRFVFAVYSLLYTRTQQTYTRAHTHAHVHGFSGALLTTLTTAHARRFARKEGQTARRPARPAAAPLGSDGSLPGSARGILRPSPPPWATAAIASRWCLSRRGRTSVSRSGRSRSLTATSHSLFSTARAKRTLQT